MAAERLGPGARERDLPDGGGGLAVLQLERAARQLQHGAAERDRAGRHHQHVALLARAARAMSAASEASQFSFTRPAAASTSSDEPTLTTMRRKSARTGVLRDMAARSASRSHGGAVGNYGCQASAGASPASPPRVAVDHCQQRAQRLGHALPRRRRRCTSGVFFAARFSRATCCLSCSGVERVGLVERDDLGLVGQAVAIGFELGAHGLVGLAGVLAGAVDQMQQHAAALDVAEEAVAEAGAFVRALDQARECRRARTRASSMRTTPSCGCSVVNG